MQSSKSSNGLVHSFAVLFGISSWVGMNGLWAELPVLVRELPEAWSLSTYIVIVSQLANLGPITYSLARRRYTRKVLEIPVIHLIMIVGLISCLLLIFFWNKTTMVGGNSHSTALLILTFALSLVDCSSSVLYMPFMANFKEIYLISYMIGEGMSGLLPSIVALGQGVGGNPECRKIAYNSTYYQYEEYHSPPRFSVPIYMTILTLMVSFSWIAFILLSNLQLSKREWVTLTPVTGPPIPAVQETMIASGKLEFTSSTEASSATQKPLLTKKTTMSNKRYATLLAIEAYIAFFHLSILSIQTYSCLPYGNMAYHLAVNLSGMTQPVLCFLAMFLWAKSLISLLSLGVFASACGAYALYTAASSPYPPLVDSSYGAAIVVLTWILVVGSMSYAKASVAISLRRDGGHSALFWCGVVTQIGSAIGAILTFFLVNKAQLFHSYSPCQHMT